MNNGSIARYLADFHKLESKIIENKDDWTLCLRKVAISRFSELGFPTTRLEDWKYTNVSPLTGIPFQFIWDKPQLMPDSFMNFPFFSFNGSRLAFINGDYTESLSSVLANLAPTAGSLKRAVMEQKQLVERHLAKYAAYQDHSFTALNTAFMADGAFLFIPDNMIIEDPIYLLFITMAPGQLPAFPHRNLIVMGKNSQANVVEIYVSPAGGAYFTNVVTEAVVGENAVLDHYKMQRESPLAFHIASTHVRLDRNSSFSSHSFSLGSSLVRNEIDVAFEGEGGSCILNGLYIGGETQHIDNHTRIEHIKPRCTSRELYKGILSGRSHGVFDGKLFVHKNAFKSDAQQISRNLLLSEDALVDTKPQLEIYADDVKCSHGATVGQLDSDALFYLRSRGIPLEEAKAILTNAFAGEVIGNVKIDMIRDHLGSCLAKMLSQCQKEVVPV